MLALLLRRYLSQTGVGVAAGCGSPVHHYRLLERLGDARLK